MRRRGTSLRVALVVAAAAVASVACSSSGGGAHPSGVKHANRGSLEMRPLIMPGRRTTHVPSNLFGSLRVPADEAAYSKLRPAVRADLVKALRGVDCAHPPKLAGSADRVVCDSESDAFLLGPSVFTANDVAGAKATPPSSDGSEPWQIQLTLTSAGAQKAYRWTSRHHVATIVGAYNDVQTSTRAPCGTETATPCADFMAYVVDGTAVSLTVTATPLQTRVLFGGDFNDRVSTTKLAHKIFR